MSRVGRNPLHRLRAHVVADAQLDCPIGGLLMRRRTPAWNYPRAGQNGTSIGVRRR